MQPDLNYYTYVLTFSSVLLRCFIRTYYSVIKAYSDFDIVMGLRRGECEVCPVKIYFHRQDDRTI